MRAFAAALLATLSIAFETDDLYNPFVQWMSEHGKGYKTVDEFMFRFQTWRENHESIKRFNFTEGMTSTVNHNKFSDWTKEERKAYLTFKPSDMPKASFTSVFKTDDLPAEIDWTTKGAVNDVQDQGQCGSCWAFSAIASMEGQHFVQSGELVKLSEQQCVDCDSDSYGCNGGWQDNCMWYVFDNGGIETEEDYPYKAYNDLCMADYNAGPVQVSSVHHVTGHSEDQLKAAIANGPTSVTIDAQSNIFYFYESGVITDDSCGSSLDHAVTAVGYGTEDGQDYYLVRNSWGTGWGDKGYAKIGRNGDGLGICGIQEISYWASTN